MQLLQGHTKRVNSVAFSPDGRLLASCGTDLTARVWDTRSGNGRVIATAETEIFHDFETVAFGAGGEHVLTRSKRGQVRAWGVSGGRLATTLLTPSSIFPCGMASSRAARLAAANDCGPRPGEYAVRVWDTTTWAGRVVHRTTDNCALAGLAFNPTSTRLVTNVGVFEVGTGKQTLDARFAGSTLAWSPDGRAIAGFGYGPTIEVQDAATGKHLTTLSVGLKHVQGFAFHPSGDALAAVSNAAVVRIWDTRTWAERPSLAWDIGQLKCIAFSPDGLRAACGSSRGTILVWDWDG